jgi:hypothetical protein
VVDNNALEGRNDMSDSVTVVRLPDCDLCGDKAAYDSRLKNETSWAYLCEDDYARFGLGVLGTGLGQRLVLKELTVSA